MADLFIVAGVLLVVAVVVFMPPRVKRMPQKKSEPSRSTVKPSAADPVSRSSDEAPATHTPEPAEQKDADKNSFDDGVQARDNEPTEGGSPKPVMQKNLVDELLQSNKRVVRFYLPVGKKRENGGFVESDFLVQLAGGRLVLLAVKYPAGKVRCDKRDSWTAWDESDACYDAPNECARTMQKVTKLQKGLIDAGVVPRGTVVYAAVVYAHQALTLVTEINPISLHCNVCHVNTLMHTLRVWAQPEVQTSEQEVQRFRNIKQRLKRGGLNRAVA